MLTKPRCLLLALLLAIGATVAAAQERPDRPRGPGGGPPGEQQRQAPAGPGVLRLLPSDSVTQHSITVAGAKLDYTATAGTFPLYDQSGERSAAIFYTAFVAKGPGTANRPVTFAFNGGPGAASAFLNLGLVGPRIAQFGLDGRDGAATKLEDNPDTWLAFTDLVLIDPVGTGWSRAAKADGANAFWGVRPDEVDGQGGRALCQQQWPRRLAQISARRKLWRIPRR